MSLFKFNLIDLTLYKNKKDDDRFLNELFESLKNVDIELQKRTDMFQFLREFTSFLHSLQQTREPFFKTLHEHGILTVIEVALVSLNGIFFFVAFELK